jgi:L-asparaginase II
VARLLVEVTRGDRVESRHRGSIAVVSSSGDLVWSFGDADEFAFIRSAAKPFQLAPFVASGRFDAYDFPNPTESLAIMAASHSGEDRHVRTVQAILRAGGLTRDVLACGVHTPFDVETAQRLIRDGEPLTPLRHNCSGKHAAMALHAKAAGWPIETYWQPDHPVQQLALDTVALMSGVDRSEIVTATDGCGVVAFGLPISGLALAYARLADPSGVEEPALRRAFERIRDAMMAHPELVGGDRRRFDTELMRRRPGAVVSKAGAEGVKGIGVLRDEAPSAPFGLALKIEDGDHARRAGDVAASAAMARLGVLDVDGLARMGELASPRIVDSRGDDVGEVRPVSELSGTVH